MLIQPCSLSQITMSSIDTLKQQLCRHQAGHALLVQHTYACIMQTKAANTTLTRHSYIHTHICSLLALLVYKQKLWEHVLHGWF